MATETPLTLATIEEDKKPKETTTAVKKRGILSRIFGGFFGIFRIGKRDDYAKRLQHIQKEEDSVLKRMQRRSRSWRTTARNLIVLSILLEVTAVGYAIMTTRSIDLNWKMRAIRVLPLFLLPIISSLIYYGFKSYIKMRDRKDQNTLERLREERQAKINELKERTDYYNTQQLIQRYDPDPAAKAAAASVLASKLGADSGLRMYLGEDSTTVLPNTPAARSNDSEFVSSKGLRNRKQPQPLSFSNSQASHSRSSSAGLMEEVAAANEYQNLENLQGMVVEHHPSSTVPDGGWFARIAALLVGEDPTQAYALICGSCHRHNGLARKEDFAYITYYCPHCNALNKSRQLEELAPVSTTSTAAAGGSVTSLVESPAGSSVTEEEPLLGELRPGGGGGGATPSDDSLSDKSSN